MTKILFDHIVCDGNMKAAEVALLGLSGFKKFLDRLRTSREQEDFKRHLRKYIGIWLPDCPWEVTTTNRYTVITHEAATVARRDIKKGETINYLCGTLVEMTTEEEKDLDLTRRDFSIVTSSRSKRTSLFLGPARFANHDCRANARLTTTGSWGMSVIAIRTIDEGKEITVTYGENYFGENNCECLCGSCEQAGIGGWTRSDAVPTIEKSMTPDDKQRSYSLRRKTRQYRDSYSPATPDPEKFVPVTRRYSSSRNRTVSGSSTPVGTSRGRSIKKSLSRVSSALARFSPDIDDEQAVDDSDLKTGTPRESIVNAPPLLVISETVLKPNLNNETESICTAPTIKEEEMEMDEPRIGRPERLTKMGSEENLPEGIPEVEPFHNDVDQQLVGSTAVSISTPSLKRGADQLDIDETTIKRPRIDALQSLHSGLVLSFASQRSDAIRQSSRRSISPDSLFEKDQITQVGSPISSQADGQMEVTPVFKLEETQHVATEESVPLSKPLDEESDLSDLDSGEEFDDKIMQIVRRKRRKVSSKKQYKSSLALETPEIPRIRYPGDYAMTPILLAEPFSCWTQCKTCKNVWVQANGYCIRRECPRCERHSKIYGYQWPKMYDPKTERVADHRTVHRFLTVIEQDEWRSKIKFLE